MAGKSGDKSPHSKLGEVEGALEGALFGLDLFLQLENAVKNHFRPRWATGNVDVDGNNLIASLNNSVIVEDAAGSGARSHGDDPLGFRHLIVKHANHRRHFLREAAGDDHQVGLTGRGAEDLSAKARHVETRGCHGHHFDGAARKAKTQRPNGTFASPVHRLIELGEDNAFVLEKLAEIVGFGERDVFGQGRFHGSPLHVFWHRGSDETNGQD